MPKVITVIVSEERRGAGRDGDPVRIVTQYHTCGGDFLAERDEWAEQQKQKSGPGQHE